MNPFLLLLIGVIVVVGGILVFRLHPFIALTLGAFAVAFFTSEKLLLNYALHAGLSQQDVKSLTEMSVGTRVAVAFGNTSGKIGILIAMASVIGGCLLKSGGAERIVRSALQLFGEKRAPAALASSSFTLAIPVFFDTVFYLMIPLVKALALRTKKNYALYVMMVVAGSAMAHSLVPPTPGPLLVASELGVNIGMMILGGILVGIITLTVGYGYAVWSNHKWIVPLRSTSETSLEELESLSAQNETRLPSLWVSILPILLPVLFIAGNTILLATLGRAGEPTPFEATVLKTFAIIGDSNIALTIAAGISVFSLTYKVRERSVVKKTIVDALSSAGIIILITSAGGAFGNMLNQTDIGFRIKELATIYQISLLPLAFVTAALVRTAQGSATVAMVTAIGILGSLASSPESLGFHPVYMALAIGCGSKLFPWMNDSGFWIICTMTGMTEKETIRNFSFLLSIMGIAGLIAIMILARFFPMV